MFAVELEFVEVLGNIGTLEKLQEMLLIQSAPEATESHGLRFQDRYPMFLDALVHHVIHGRGN